MTDRLPQPMRGVALDAPVVERASATPIVRAARPRTKARMQKVSGNVPRTLRDVQTWMVEAIAGAEPDAADVSAIVTRGPKLSAEGRLDVYRSGYLARLVECLADDYPVLVRTLGDECFETLCHAYVAKHPSTSPSLNAFGRHMPAFCLEADVLGDDRLFLSELALLEWTLVEMIHAELAPPFDASALQSIPPEQLGSVRFEKSDAVRLLRTEYPVNAYYQAHRGRDEHAPIPSRAPTATAVYRQGLSLWRMDLTPAMARVLDALLEGQALEDALERMGTNEADPEALAEAERNVMVWFREWIGAGMFRALRQ